MTCLKYNFLKILILYETIQVSTILLVTDQNGFASKQIISVKFNLRVDHISLYKHDCKFFLDNKDLKTYILCASTVNILGFTSDFFRGEILKIYFGKNIIFSLKLLQKWTL